MHDVDVLLLNQVGFPILDGLELVQSGFVGIYVIVDKDEPHPVDGKIAYQGLELQGVYEGKGPKYVEDVA